MESNRPADDTQSRASAPNEPPTAPTRRRLAHAVPGGLLAVALAATVGMLGGVGAFTFG